jgi:hypothetical protein
MTRCSDRGPARRPAGRKYVQARYFVRYEDSRAVDANDIIQAEVALAQFVVRNLG